MSAGVSQTVDRLVMRLFGRFRSRDVLIGAFVLSTITSIAFTVWLTLSSGARVVQEVLVEVASGIHRESAREVERFISFPDLINQHTLHALRSKRVVRGDADALHRLFWDAPRDSDRSVVSAMYFGDENGDYAGFSAAHGTWPPEGWHYSIASAGTGGELTLLSITDDGRPDGRRSVLPGSYDPRERNWYRRAAESSSEPVWTEVYRQFADDTATLTRAVPLRDEQGDLIGVFGVDLLLDHLQRFLEELARGSNNETFLVDSAGILLGASGAAYHDGPSTREPTAAVDAPQRFVRAASERLLGTHGSFENVDRVIRERTELDGVPGYLLLSPVGGDQGLDWMLGIFLPECDYLESTASQLLRVVPLALLMLLIASVVFAIFVRLVGRPLERLRDGAARIADGEFDVPIDTSHDNEVGDLARAIDDMRERLQRSFETVTEQKLLAEVTLESITDGVITMDGEGDIRYMNTVAERLTGVPLDQARGRSVETVFRARDRRTATPMTRALMLRLIADSHAIGQAVVVTSSGGETHLVHCRVSPVTDETNRRHGAVLNFSDLSEELRLKSELVHQATHDPLTDLANRREFERRTTRAIESARKREGTHVLCYIDLDRFKFVNDSAGHEAGDELLRQVARLLGTITRVGDTVGRLGGDEFGVLLEHCTIDRATRVIEQLRERVEGFRFYWEGRSHGVGISAGLVAIGPDSAGTVSVMRDADSACYIAKESGRNRMHVHSDDNERLMRLRGDHSWIEHIERAFETDGFALYAQRIVSADPDGEAHRHVEILLRMIDAHGETLSPADFLPAAERHDLAGRIDRWVVSHTFDWLVSLPGSEHVQPEICSINLSGQSLGDATMLPFIVEEMTRSGVDPSRLCFEVTETAAIANLSSALTLIDTLRELGCTFALDDFGSGLSSFAYLKSLPVDYLKIDGVFVRDMLSEPLDLAMVRSINEVGQTMGMYTIAEYVENGEIRAALHGIGVDFVQGYGVGLPEPIDVLTFPAGFALRKRGAAIGV